MKKKIIYGLLLAVSIVTASSSFVSCKDYEGDDYARLQNDLAIAQITNQTTIDELIRLQLATAQDQLNNLEGILSSLAQLYPEFPAGQYADYQSKLQDLLARANGATTLADKLKILGELNALIAQLNGIGTGANPNIVVPNAVDVILRLWGDSLRTAYETAFAAWYQAVTATEIANHNSYRIDTLSLYTLQLFNEANRIADLANQHMWNDILGQLAVRDGQIAQLGTDITNLQNTMNTKLDELTAAYQAADAALQAKIDEKDAELRALIAQNDASLRELIAQKETELTTLINEKDAALRTLIEQNYTTLTNAINQVEADYKAADAALEVRCGEIEAGYKAADEALQSQITDLQNDVTKLQKSVDNILGTLKKQITGVIIQATYSPVLGNGSLPLGIQTNLLAAYAGKNDTGEDVVFPRYYGFVSEQAPITGEDYDYLSGLGLWPAEVTIPSSQYIIGESEANAGKLYLTVNPTDIDFEGTDFKLVNSQGLVAKVELSPLKPSEETLTFGWTRSAIEAASSNGFYEVNAKITAENIADMQPAVSKDKLKAALKETLNGSKKAGVKDLARAVYASLEPLQRFGVQATWLDATTNTNRSYTSAYDVAATVVNPLSFGFELPESKYLKVPTFNKHIVADSLHFDINVPLLVITAQDKATGKYVIPVEVPELYLNPDLYEIIDGQTFYAGYAVYKPEQAAAIWKFDGYEVRSGYAYIDFTNMFEELFGQFNTAFASFGKLGDQINGKIDNVVEKINSYIDRYNSYANRINKYIANFNNLLQPVLLWSDGQNAGQLEGFVSANYAVATTIPAGGAVALYPTSYSLELIAPAYKKSLIVTNVYKKDAATGVMISAQGAGDRDGLQSALVAVNNELKAQGFDIFEGQGLKKPFLFNGAGYEGMTFEFSYTAVDYTAKVAGRKFYLTVGE